jgi:hypothetical protein
MAARGCSMPQAKFVVKGVIQDLGERYNPGDLIELEVDKDGKPTSRLYASRVVPAGKQRGSAGDSGSKDAKAQGKAIVDKAKTDAEAIVADAQTEAEAIVQKAEEDAAEILNQAKSAADQMMADASKPKPK